MKSREIRNKFVSYFEKNDHRVKASSSLVPQDDPTLMFANAGMNQFKNVFLGLEPIDHPRAVSVQKCVRAGGKHNDLENVGFTARHHTFFEMLGNFSFGDYFKKDAIRFAWELLTKEYGIPKDKLYVTVFREDDEAADIWHKQEGVPKDRIYRFDEKDNFWRMGDVGPCGPCTEIYYDHGPDADKGQDKPSVLGGDGDRYVEIWNLVFMQYYEDGKTRTALPKPSVDTGAGFERMAAALQAKPTNYDTDIFAPLIDTAKKFSKKDYVTDLIELKNNSEARAITSAFRVVADHARATAFLIADGVLPSNEGRGYVLRRIMRRAIRYARNLSDHPDIFPQVVSSVFDAMGEYYPQMSTRRDFVIKTTQDEVARFLITLDQGTEILNQQIKTLSKGDTLSGDVVFKLYDTFGFPADLTRLIAHEKGIQVNEDAFEAKMSEAREKAKSSWKGSGPNSDQKHLIQWAAQTAEKHGATQFTGYKTMYEQGQVLSLSNGKDEVQKLSEGQTGFAILNRTSLYAESGGQVGDQGYLVDQIMFKGKDALVEVTKTGSKFLAEVKDVTKKSNVHILEIEVVRGELSRGQAVFQGVDLKSRKATMSNHSATHLLHSALRKVLGDHVTQAGSLVTPDRLRFDFTHNSSLSADEIKKIEALVNAEVAQGHAIGTSEKSYDDAIKAGAMALFGEKYGDKVRVIQMGEFSTELCGGTHVENTATIRLFKIVSEGGVSSGVRRIEAITGDRALEYFQKADQELKSFKNAVGVHENWMTFLENSGESSLQVWLEKNKQQFKDLEKSIRSAQSQSVDFKSVIAAAPKVKIKGQDVPLVYHHFDMDDRKMLSEMSDRFKDHLSSGIIIVTGKGEGGSPLIVSVTKDLATQMGAGQIVKNITTKWGGKGGGRPDFAQGSVDQLEDFKKNVQTIF